jgi:hypothetical protein
VFCILPQEIHILVFRSKTVLAVSGMVIMPKVVGILRQGYTECNAASKIFNKPHPKMAF